MANAAFTRQDPAGNLLLAALPCEVLARWAPALKPVALASGQLLADHHKTMKFVYFPTTSIVSLLHATKTGATAEVALVGDEGMVGTSVLMGDGITTGQIVVQAAGHALELPASALQEEFRRAGPVMELLLRYTQALMTQMAQTAVCNRHHSVHAQVCRWLLLSLDRLHGDELLMTQEMIASMLGVRRAGLTRVASDLKDNQLIDYSRGRIKVLDRHGLEKCACECYGVVRKEYDRLLPRQRVTAGSDRPVQINLARRQRDAED